MKAWRLGLMEVFGPRSLQASREGIMRAERRGSVSLRVPPHRRFAVHD